MSSDYSLPIAAAVVALGCVVMAAGLASVRFPRGRWHQGIVAAFAGLILIGGAVRWLDGCDRYELPDFDPAMKWADLPPDWDQQVPADGDPAEYAPPAATRVPIFALSPGQSK